MIFIISFRRSQELSFVSSVSSVSSITGAQFRGLQELSFVSFVSFRLFRRLQETSFVSTVSFRRLQETSFVSFVSSVSFRQFRFVEYRKPGVLMMLEYLTLTYTCYRLAQQWSLQLCPVRYNSLLTLTLLGRQFRVVIHNQ